MRLSLVLAGLAVAAVPVSGQWSEPVNVSRIGSGRQTWYQGIAVDSFGTVHACWSHIMENDYDWIEYACKPAGVDTWTIPVHVSRDAFPYRGCVIAIGPGHVPHIVWQSDYEPGHIYISHKDDDTWTIPERLTSWNRSGRWIRAAGDSFGRIHIVWNDAGGARVIWYARYEASGWSRPETVVASADTFRISGASVAADRQGHAHLSASVYWPDTFPPVYIRQTLTGWTSPEFLPRASGGLPDMTRIAVDSLDHPHFVWSEGFRVYCSSRRGDSWTLPVALDTSPPSGDPAIAIDPWGQLHVVFPNAWYGGLVERVGWRGRWCEPVMVASDGTVAEVTADPHRLHALWHRTDIWHSTRILEPPGIGLKTSLTICASQAGQNPVTWMTALAFELTKPARAMVSIFDASGRRLALIDMGRLDIGKHRFRPYPHLPSPGVFVCRVWADGGAMSFRLVRSD
jgi:hypothetical protein